MDLFFYAAAVFSSGIPDEPLEVLTDSAEAALQSIDSSAALFDTEFVTKYMNFEFFETLLKEDFVYIFLTGFAFATVLVLLTYGAFKAFGLIRIKS